MNKLEDNLFRHLTGNANVPRLAESNNNLGQKFMMNKNTQQINENIIKRKCVSNTREEMRQEMTLCLQLMFHISYAILICFGFLRDLLRNIGIEKKRSALERDRQGYVPLYQSSENFFTRNLYRRVCDVCCIPITSCPGALIDVMDRTTIDYNWTFQYPGTTSRVINMGSYNYLGFAENSGYNVNRVENTINKYGIGVSTTRHEIGTTAIHKELEALLPQFLGVESSVVFGMGFATNSTNIPTLAGKGTLIISDECNHSSIILGCKMSGASKVVFKHNDMEDLENKIIKHIIDGQVRTGRPWKKIIIIVEGIYSMEGTIVNLPEIIKLKKKYKCYVYLDEAHSIGAIGERGRGVCDYYGCDISDIDLLMGTFTKSFGAAGGYIAGKKQIIDHIVIHSQSACYASAMSPCIAQQIISAIHVIQGFDGTDDGQTRITRLASNTRYFRSRLKQMGFIVYGSDDSPVVPILISFGAKLVAVVRMAIANGIGIISVGYPATPMSKGRVRFCVSASHSKAMIDKALDVMNVVGNELSIKYSKQSKNIIRNDK